jgi:reticulon-4-interacting protein 1, mitochondrial
VRATGGAVKNLKIGMEAMGVVPPPADGSHSKFVVTSSFNVVKKPSEKSFEEAAAIPYTGLTAWSALKITGELCLGARNKQILVLGGSGGVGSLAIQLLKNWGSAVAATCPPDSIDTCRALGADVVIDYTAPDADIELKQFGG